MKIEKIPVFARRGSDGVYEIGFSSQGRYRVFYGNKMFESKGESLKIEVPFPGERAVFSVRRDDESDETYVSEKLIPMRGVPNFRDLGGIINKNGKQIKWGKIFRSGMLSRLTGEDSLYFKTLAIKTVIDFRGDREAEREPDKLPRDYPVNYIRVPVGNPSDIEKLSDILGRSREAEETFKSLMLRGAEILTGSPEHFKPVFEAMERGESFLFHCSAGKDRTGFAAALILSALDVGRDEIVDDYLLSNKYTVPYFEKYISIITDMGISKDIALAATGVRKEFLDAVFAMIDAKYGKFDNMLSEVFGIDAGKKSRLMEKYTI